MKKIHFAALFAVLASLKFTSCHAAKVLIYPYDLCHSIPFKNLVKSAKILAEKGYDVTVLTSSLCATESGLEHVHVVSYSVPELPKNGMTQPGSICDSFHWQTEVTDSLNILCNSLLRRRYMIIQLQLEEFDLFLTDDLNLCARVLADYLALPTIILNNCGLDSVFAPLFPPLHTSLFASHSIWGRFKGMVSYVIHFQFYIPNHIYSPVDEIKDSYGYNKGLSISDTYSRLKPLILSNSDFSIENPRPIMPYVIPISGFLCEENRSLPEDVKDFIQSSGEDGIAYVDLGEGMNWFYQAKFVMIAKVLLKFKQKIIWKSSKDFIYAGKIKIVQTVTEYDILSHPKTVLWITNCDHGSLDSVNHGVPVPVIILPSTPESSWTCQQMVQKHGTGKSLSIIDMNEAEFENAIMEVLGNVKFKANARQLSNVFKDQLKPSKEKFFFWVDFVIRHKGVQHLWNDQLGQLRWYEFCMLDVAFLMVIAFLVGSFLTLLMLYIFMKIFLKQFTAKKRKSH
eukprot:Seg1614.11 transcript_id=Seg1614.11/GoldUCD/mRNA.D3Y31 product="UDP-glucuronosyltransferase 1-3" protein_id=Seg1614.11/GoldUCD/D3Y31